MRAFFFAGAACAVLAAFQGVPPQGEPLQLPQAPADAALLPPVQDPPPTRVEREDVLQRFVPETPLTGFWRLRSITVGGEVVTDQIRGYLCLGRTHMSLQIMQSVGDEVLLQSGFRSYRVEDDELVTTALMGFDNHKDGELRFEQPAFVERRQFHVAGAILRVMQGQQRFMEFERIE